MSTEEIEVLKKNILLFRNNLEKQMDIFKEHKDIRKEYELRLETIDQILSMTDILLNVQSEQEK